MCRLVYISLDIYSIWVRKDRRHLQQPAFNRTNRTISVRILLCIKGVCSWSSWNWMSSSRIERKAFVRHIMNLKKENLFFFVCARKNCCRDRSRHWQKYHDPRVLRNWIWYSLHSCIYFNGKFIMNSKQPVKCCDNYIWLGALYYS